MTHQPEPEKSERDIRRLADKFFGRTADELRGDPDFEQLTKEDVSDLGVEYVRRATVAAGETEEFAALESRASPPRSDQATGEVSWTQLGSNLAFSLEVGGRIVGHAYWFDTEGLEAEDAPDGGSLPESGWYWVSVIEPRHPHRVAEGLALGRDMSEEDFGETVDQALRDIAADVLADGDA